MALTANPAIGMPSNGGRISSMKLFQDLSGPVNPTQGTTTSLSYAFTYAIWNSTNSAFLTLLLAAQGLSPSGYTAIVFGAGEGNNGDLWATRDAVATSGLCAGTTKFTKISPVTPQGFLADGNINFLSAFGN